MKNHHAYKGGLIQHVVSLMELCLVVAPRYPELDSDLLLIGAFSASTGRQPPGTRSATVQARRAFSPWPGQARDVTRPAAPKPRAVIHVSNPRNDGDLREWKKRNAEAMKILEKTTKEVPLR